MHLYLIRHGESEEGDMSDEERALTPAGHQAVKTIARHITELPDEPTAIFSSPLRRALETARAFSEGWELIPQSVDWLRPSAEPSRVLAELSETRHETVALVGHLPNLGLVMSTLLCGLPPREMSLPKGGVAHLEVNAWEPGAAKICWLLTPDLLRQ